MSCCKGIKQLFQHNHQEIELDKELTKGRFSLSFLKIEKNNPLKIIDEMREIMKIQVISYKNDQPVLDEAMCIEQIQQFQRYLQTEGKDIVKQISKQDHEKEDIKILHKQLCSLVEDILNGRI